MTNFTEVLDGELELIKGQLGKNQGSDKSKGNLTGLAFSGGGIRSATFNLGIIQSLAKKTHLGKFDYLSTVSGGGYIGSWLSAQIHRHTSKNGTANEATYNQKVEQFQNSISNSQASGAEPDSIKWLRSYSNYLTPRKGLSGDTLSALGSWLRNTLLNQTALVLIFAVAMLLPQLVPLTLNNIGWLSQLSSGIWLPISAGLIFLATLFCALTLPRLRCCDDSKYTEVPNKLERQFVWLIIPLAVLSAYSLSLWMYSISIYTKIWLNNPYQPSIHILPKLWNEHPLFGEPDNISFFAAIPAASFSSSLIAGMWSVIYVLPWLVYLAYSMATLKSTKCTNPEEQQISNPFWFAIGTILSALSAGAAGGWLIYQLSNVIARRDETMRLWWATGFGTPLLLLIFCLILVLHQGLMARLFRVSQLEWWARLGGYILLIATAWAGIHILLIYVPPLLNMLENKFIAAGGILWALHSLAGILLGKSAATSGKGGVQWKELITRAAPYMFVLGYLIAISWAVHALIFKFGTGGTPQKLNLPAPETTAIPPAGDYWAQHCTPLDCSLYHAPPTFSELLDYALQINNHADLVTLWLILACGAIAFLALAWRLDVNLFSIHHFYRNRLTRCYLGAGRGDMRRPNPFTGFDPCDDIKLAELKQRPLHLVNTALNLVHNGNLAWQDRKAYSFTFSSVACGFEYPPNTSQPGGGYYNSAQYMDGVRLGTAIAVSGAAASPNMGYHSSPGVAFLLTVFNFRLGRWCPNPGAKTIRQNIIKRESPIIGGEYLFKEMFGLTDDKNDFVYLSDGGHFENLGVYELVRRRCHDIMVIDAGEDKDRTFEDAANLIRKCYIDFGVIIDIRLESLRAAKEGNIKGNCETCYALGDIIYPPQEAGKDGDWGVLLYIKPSLLKDIPDDIRQYAKANIDFPHQTTGDQFFDEAQFESYRHLGNFLMDEVLKSVSQHKTPRGKSWHLMDT